MPSPARLTRVLAISLLANIAQDLIGFLKLQRCTAMKNPNAVLLSHRRPRVDRPQGETLVFALECEAIARC
jgi:hypothetical protein